MSDSSSDTPVSEQKKNKTEEKNLGNKENQELGFIGHLMELRDRLLRSVVVVILIFLCAFPFANDIYHILALPLVNNLPEGGTMIATGVISPFLTPLKLAFIMSIFAAFPYLIFQAWAFIAPGLYKHEKKTGNTLNCFQCDFVLCRHCLCLPCRFAQCIYFYDVNGDWWSNARP